MNIPDTFLSAAKVLCRQSRRFTYCIHIIECENGVLWLGFGPIYNQGLFISLFHHWYISSNEVSIAASYGPMNTLQNSVQGTHPKKPRMSLVSKLCDIFGTHEEVLSFFSHMLQFLISAAWLAHVKGILPKLGEPSRIIAIVIDHAAEDGVPAGSSINVMKSKDRIGDSPHALVHIHGNLIAGTDIQIHKPGIVDV